MEPAPPPRNLPAFALWLKLRDISERKAGRVLGCSHETIRLLCLPFDDDARRVPGKKLMEKIFTWTSGEIRPRDFYPYDQEAKSQGVAA